jgi:hypothetical protein
LADDYALDTQILLCHDLLVANHHRHVRRKAHNLAAPIILIVILVYAAQWAFRIPLRNLAAGIAIAGAAAFLWILNPRKDR